MEGTYFNDYKLASLLLFNSPFYRFNINVFSKVQSGGEYCSSFFPIDALGNA